MQLTDYQQQLLVQRSVYVAQTIFDKFKDNIIHNNSVDLIIQYSSPAEIYIRKYENDPGVIEDEKEDFFRISGFYNMFNIYVFPRNILEIAKILVSDTAPIEVLLDAVDTVTVSTLIHEMLHADQDIPSYNKPEIPEYCKIEDSVHEMTLFIILDYLKDINKLIDGNVNVSFIAREFLLRDKNRPTNTQRYTMYDFDSRPSWRHTAEDIILKVADINYSINPKSQKRNMNKVKKALSERYHILFIIFKEDIAYNTTGDDIQYWLDNKDGSSNIDNINLAARYLSEVGRLGDKFSLNTITEVNHQYKTVIVGIGVTEIDPFDPCYFIK